MTLLVKVMPVGTFLVVMATYCMMTVSCCACAVILSVEDFDESFSLLEENENADDEAVTSKQSTILICDHLGSIVMHDFRACPHARHHRVVHRAVPLIASIPSYDQANVSASCHGESRLRRPTCCLFCYVLLVAHLRAFLSCEYQLASGDEVACCHHPRVSRELIGVPYWECPCQDY